MCIVSVKPMVAVASRELDLATASLGPSAFCRQRTVIYCGDSLDLMQRLPSGIVSLTVTSPPYNIGKEYETPLALDQYLDWSARWIAEVYRVTKPNGALWLNLGYVELPGRAKALPIPYLLWHRIPFFIVQEIVWNYGAGVAGKRVFSPRNEKFLWCVKNPQEYKFYLDRIRDKDVKYPNQRKNGKLKCNPDGKNPTDVWQIPKVTSGKNRASKERTEHPAQFPVALIARIVEACSDEGDLVLDPFAGSGSTAEVCLRHKRSFLGIEIVPRYIELAERRLTQYLRDQREAGA
jgi:adenine-specific DNA-methyltransferase